MLIEITPVTNRAYDCLLTPIVTICSWLKRDFQLMFAETWNFTFRQNTLQETIRYGERIAYNDGDWVSLLERYHGVKLNLCRGITENEAHEQIITELNASRPVIVFFQSYWCPWSPDFKKEEQDGPHYFMISGFDGVNYICIDGIYLNSPVILSRNYFKRGFKGTYATFRLKLEEDIVPCPYKQIIKSAADGFILSETPRQIGLFAREISHSFNIKAEGEKYIINAPLIRNLEGIARGRMKFGIFLRYVGERYGAEKLMTVSDEFMSIGNSWAAIQRMFIKMWFAPATQSSVLKKIVDELFRLADQEEKVAMELRENLANTGN